MPRQENILSVFVASPSDVSEERLRLEEVVHELNQLWSKNLKTRLDLIKWETHAYPGFGSDPQDVINQQISQNFDIFIGIMWHRFGTATGRADSGTEEEFMRAKLGWEKDHDSVNLMIYFKDAPVALNLIDPAQLMKVAEFRKSLGSEGGLYWSFQSTDDFANLVRMHLTRVVQDWQYKLPSINSGLASAVPVGALTVSVTNIEALDEEETGLFELIENYEDKFHDMGEAFDRISKATEIIGNKMGQHTKRLELAASKSTSRTGMKRLITKSADDLNDFAGKLGQEIPFLLNLFQAGLGALSQAISLLPDFSGSQTSSEQITRIVGEMEELKAIMFGVEGEIQNFLYAVSAMPRITSDLNRAKRAVSRELQNLIDLIRSQQQLLDQASKAANSLQNNCDNR